MVYLPSWVRSCRRPLAELHSLSSNLTLESLAGRTIIVQLTQTDDEHQHPSLQLHRNLSGTEGFWRAFRYAHDWQTKRDGLCSNKRARRFAAADRKAHRAPPRH
jgi:hypothetical protein